MNPDQLGLTSRMEPHIKHVLDASAGGAALASWFGLLQPVVATVASVLSIVWLSLQIADWIAKKRRPQPEPKG